MALRVQLPAQAGDWDKTYIILYTGVACVCVCVCVCYIYIVIYRSIYRLCRQNKAHGLCPIQPNKWKLLTSESRGRLHGFWVVAKVRRAIHHLLGFRRKVSGQNDPNRPMCHSPIAQLILLAGSAEKNGGINVYQHDQMPDIEWPLTQFFKYIAHCFRNAHI